MDSKAGTSKDSTKGSIIDSKVGTSKVFTKDSMADSEGDLLEGFTAVAFMAVSMMASTAASIMTEGKMQVVVRK
jgi:hypothetical protein